MNKIQKKLEKIFKEKNLKKGVLYTIPLPIKPEINVPKLFKEDTGYLLMEKIGNRPLKYIHINQSQIDSEAPDDKKLDKALDKRLKYFDKYERQSLN
tara:strand:+ start:2277 stop:2567 length:291 start_codon:yes stop_codon:yes gene_type:complete